MVEWLKEEQDGLSKTVQQVKDIKRLCQTQSSRVVQLERRLKEAQKETEVELFENHLLTPIRPAGKQDCQTFQQMKYLKRNVDFNDGKCNRSRMENIEDNATSHKEEEDHG